MSEEIIKHIYCDGNNCCESIDGYNPDAKDSFIISDLQKRGWAISCFGEKHLCPKCKKQALKNAEKE